MKQPGTSSTTLVFALRRFLHSQKMSQLELARATGVAQSQVSRILAFKTKRVSKNMQIICDYAHIDWRSTQRTVDDHPRLMATIVAAWDGTDRGGDALANLISAAAELRDIHAL